MVLAADPPLISTAVPSARYSRTARSVSISSIEPLTSEWSARKVSAAWAITSTSALPIPTTSKRGAGTGRNATAAGTSSPCTQPAPRAPRRYGGPVTATQETPTLDPFRLPRGAVPTRYDVELAPDLSAAMFTGRVEISVDVL